MKATSKSDWYKTCRPHLEWTNWDPQWDLEEYTDQIIERALAIESDTLLYCWESGGYLLYPGDLAPQYEHLHGRDLLGVLQKKAHAHGLKFVICFLGLSANTYLSETRPDWVQRDADGNLIAKWHGYHFRSMCPNSPYSHYLYDITVDLLKRYALDGIYVEGVYMGQGYCHCDYCQKVYGERFGKAVPTEHLEEDVEYNVFRQDSFLRPFAAIRRAIDDVKPETVFFACTGTTYYFGTQADDVGRVAEISDVVCLEAQWNYDLPDGYNPSWAPTLQESGMIMRIVRAEGNRPALGTVWVGKHVDQNYAPRTAANVILNYQELLFQGALVQVHTQNALEVDSKLTPTLHRLYRDAAILWPYMSDAELTAYAAIVDWATLDHPTEYMDESQKGAYKAMQEGHIPVRFTTPQRMKEGQDADTCVWILPNVKRMDDETAARICEYVDEGGGLVLTSASIQAHPKLAKLAGVRHVQSVCKDEDEFPLHTYYRMENGEAAYCNLAGTVLSFVGTYEQVECSDGAEVYGHILDLDLPKKSDKHILQVCWPGEPVAPMLTSRDVGNGRVVYIAADLCAAARRYGDANSLEMLAAAVQHAGRKPLPVTTNCPPCVEVVLHQKKHSLAVCLLNQTTNQYMADPIRYVVPLADIQVHVNWNKRKPKSIRSLTGQKIQASDQNGMLQLQMPGLAEYEAILIDFQGL